MLEFILGSGTSKKAEAVYEDIEKRLDNMDKRFENMDMRINNKEQKIIIIHRNI